MILYRFRFWIVQSFPILILVMLSGCVKSPSEPASQEPASITLSTHTVVLTSIGQRLLINATVLDQDSKVIADATIFYRSGNVNGVVPNLVEIAMKKAPRYIGYVHHGNNACTLFPKEPYDEESILPAWYRQEDICAVIESRGGHGMLR